MGFLQDVFSNPGKAFGSDLTGGNSAFAAVGNGLVNDVTTAADAIGSYVDNKIPGGWATVGAAALIAAGIYNSDLLTAADDGTLTSTDLLMLVCLHPN